MAKGWNCLRHHSSLQRLLIIHKPACFKHSKGRDIPPGFTEEIAKAECHSVVTFSVSSIESGVGKSLNSFTEKIFNSDDNNVVIRKQLHFCLWWNRFLHWISTLGRPEFKKITLSVQLHPLLQSKSHAWANAEHIEFQKNLRSFLKQQSAICYPGLVFDVILIYLSLTLVHPSFLVCARSSFYNCSWYLTHRHHQCHTRHHPLAEHSQSPQFGWLYSQARELLRLSFCSAMTL